MVPTKSLDEYQLIAATLYDVHTSHGVVFNTRSLRLTCNKVRARMNAEGLGFLTKTLPRLGKAFDKALSANTPLDSAKLGFPTKRNSKLPMLLGELFEKVLHPDGTILQEPCAECVKSIRQVMYLFYKYELPYDTKQEQDVIKRFKETEAAISTHSDVLRSIDCRTEDSYRFRKNRYRACSPEAITREARILLEKVFANLDLSDIVPKHGPGSVATRQRLWDKYVWTNVSRRITDVFPLDEYFYASLGHVCDVYKNQSFEKMTDFDLPARVILVPKDSRGPRLISCEPVDFQWIQQGVAKAIMSHVERIELTKFNVFFTDQVPNRIGALYGSSTGKYATLDLNEASDRVSLGLVRLLFPPNVVKILEACRSLSTELPDGTVIPLNKYAPMGSSLCFPVLALTVWAILTAGAPDADTQESIHVYGDDVIVPTAHAANAIEQLESFGLKVNRDKSCTSGLFRESCGMDAFAGVEVTPVRLRTVWSSKPSPQSFVSWISYANQFYDRGWFATYYYIVGRLNAVYTAIPDERLSLTAPSLRYQPDNRRLFIKKRLNKSLQKLEYKVLDVKSPVIHHELDGWSMLLRYFTEGGAARPLKFRRDLTVSPGPLVRENRSTGHSFKWQVSDDESAAFSVSQYTDRGTSMLVSRWR